MRKGMRDIREKKCSTKSLRLPDLVALQGVKALFVVVRIHVALWI